MTRFVDIEHSEMTDAQRRIYDAIADGPRGTVIEPYRLLLHSPELADRVQSLGTHARFDSSLSKRLSELAILIVARKWNSTFEWYHHVRDGLAAGVSASEIEAISQSERPDFDDPRAAAVHDFCTEMLIDQAVDQATFERAIETLGTEGVVDLVGILGHYGLLAMLLNAFEVAAPGEAEIPLPL